MLEDFQTWNIALGVFRIAAYRATLAITAWAACQEIFMGKCCQRFYARIEGERRWQMTAKPIIC
jgi:hypothetical protein